MGYAEGGVVSFCAENRPHAPECEYFAEGGEIAISPDEVVLDEPVEVAPEEVVIDEPAEIPAEDVVVDEELGSSKHLPIGESIPGLGPLAESAGAAFGAGLRTLTHGGEFGENYDLIKGVHEASKRGFAERHPVAEAASELAGQSMAFPVANKAAAAVAQLANLGKTGSAVLRGAISNGLITATDQATQEFLGNDPEAPVATVLASMGLGGVLGGVGSKLGSVASRKLNELKDTKLGNYAASWLAGLGAAANSTDDVAKSKIRQTLGSEAFDQKAFEAGEKFFNKRFGVLAGGTATLGAMEGAYRGWQDDGLTGAAEEGLEGAARGLAVGLGFKAGTKVATPVLLKVMSNGGTRGMLDALNYFQRYQNGANHVEKAVNGLFDAGAKGGTAAISALDSDKERQALEDWLENGGIDNEVQEAIYEQNSVPQFAEGGEVKQQRRDDGVALHFPEQNVIMQAAKARASQYLNTLRPAKNAPKLAFDDEPDTTQQKRTYKRALSVAAKPLGILEKVKKGTVEPDDIQHLNAMFPEVVGLLQKKITERVVKDQMKGKKPPYRVRQGLSMLLGTPLSGEMTPQNIQAAQAVFAQQRAAKQQAMQASAPKASTSKLSKSEQAFLTDDQARTKRQQKI